MSTTDNASHERQVDMSSSDLSEESEEAAMERGFLEFRRSLLCLVRTCADVAEALPPDGEGLEAACAAFVPYGLFDEISMGYMLAHGMRAAWEYTSDIPWEMAIAHQDRFCTDLWRLIDPALTYAWVT